MAPPKKKKIYSTNLCRVNLALVWSEGGGRKRQRQQARVTGGRQKDMEVRNTWAGHWQLLATGQMSSICRCWCPWCYAFELHRPSWICARFTIVGVFLRSRDPNRDQSASLLRRSKAGSSSIPLKTKEKPPEEMQEVRLWVSLMPKRLTSTMELQLEAFSLKKCQAAEAKRQKIGLWLNSSQGVVHCNTSRRATGLAGHEPRDVARLFMKRLTGMWDFQSV